MPANNKQQGSILLAALMVTIVTGTLVGLFLKTISDELKHTHRYTMGLAAINLAEAGIEFALQASLRDGWGAWTSSSSGSQTRYFKDSFEDITLSSTSQTRSLKVYVQRESGTADIIIAEGTITLNNGITVKRQVGIEVETTGQRFWVNAILGRDELEFEGNKTFLDSFNSDGFDPIANPGMTIQEYYNNLRDATPPTILGHDFVNGNAGIASLSYTIGAIDIGNADVYGSLATGASQGANLNSIVGPNGSLYNQDSVYGVNIGGNDSIDEAFVSYEFYAELPIPEMPTISNATTTDPGSTIGSENTTSAYEFTDFMVANNSTKTVNGTVDIVVNDDVDIDGTLIVNGNLRLIIDDRLDLNGEIQISNQGSIEMYIGGDVNLRGNGIVNLNKPKDLIIYSTYAGSGEVDVDIRGNTVFSGTIYAPNAEIELRGGVEVFGALVGNEIEFEGNVSFHYDESLADLTNSWTEYSSQVVGWRELTTPIDMDQVMDSGYTW